MRRVLPSVGTQKQHLEQPCSKGKRWNTGIAGSNQVRTEPRKRHKLVNEPQLRYIPLSDISVRWGTLEDKGTRVPIADPAHQPRHAHRLVRPTMTYGGETRIARLEQMVEQWNAELANRRTLLEERISSLEQVNEVRKAESRKRKESGNPLSEIRGARVAWSRLLRGQGVTVSKDIPLWSDEEEEDEEQVQLEHEQSKTRTNPVKVTQPTCSKLYCIRLTVAFKSGKWKKQCEHCISLSKNKRL
jgi:hypothetical protein